MKSGDDKNADFLTCSLFFRRFRGIFALRNTDTYVSSLPERRRRRSRL
jgi:hypothetical protein